MASDMPEAMGQPVAMGQIYHEAPDVETAQKISDALAKGGKITMPFEETFWSRGFGNVIDKFGLSWAVSIPDQA